MAQTENANFSNQVRRMLGLGLDSWNNLMVAFLCIGAFAAVIVGVSTYVIIQLQKSEAKDASEAFERYKLETGKKIAEATARTLEAQAELAKFKAPRTLLPEQIARITETLNQFSGQEYALSVASGSEPENLLCVLDNILVTAGWKRHDPFGPISVGTRCGFVALNTLSGVHARVSISADAELERRALLLASALNNEGIIAQAAKDPENIPVATVINLMVGAKQ